MKKAFKTIKKNLLNKASIDVYHNTLVGFGYIFSRKIGSLRSRSRHSKWQIENTSIDKEKINIIIISWENIYITTRKNL